VTEIKQQPDQDDEDQAPGGEPPPLAYHRSCITAKGSKNEGCEIPAGSDRREKSTFRERRIHQSRAFVN
jgi:hypothetical protein